MIRQTPREKKKTINVTFKFTPEMDKNLKEIAEMENRSRTGEIEYLITRRLEELQRTVEGEMYRLKGENEYYSIIKESEEYIVIETPSQSMERLFSLYLGKNGKKRLFDLYLTNQEKLRQTINEMPFVDMKWKKPGGGLYFYDKAGNEY